MLSLNAELNNMLRTINKQKIELEEAIRQKNILLGMAAHDMRNPLNNIMMYCEFLEETEFENFNDDTKTMIATIRKMSIHTLNLIDDVLEMAKYEAGRITPNIKKINLSLLIHEAIKLNAILAQAKSISIRTKLPAYPVEVSIDTEKIIQVINNLISNAIKFSYAHTEIEISIAQENIFVEISVADQGQGIPEKEIDKLFKPYSLLSVRPTAGERSSGLGLYIVKKIIEGHG